ncbi:ABC transporter ATP-binding protein [Fluviicola taffensis]|uniref:Phosphonate-transporting ATPase n=1 Tax=Fluviicola taffensis (strain DSM 16823 / NCIMB 13979 / RW262) TaxID=755732 RepID=F2ICG1_FLUTR|nr:ABC transporter ATP-binding protein [Fluviicola taffensis]AEA45431.1 Phosphonate-transporting ATPase [Fluviicola taffensis DSM 16823]
MLVAKGIRKKYGQLDVLKGIDLEIKSGEIVSIVGSSGAGKTTLLQILGTLDKPDSGELTLNGINPFTLNSRGLAEFRNQKIGFIFQFHQLLPEFTALENVLMPALIGGKALNESKVRAKHLLQKLGLQDRENHQPSALSGGEQQRVAVARALMNEPDIIFADEPSGNLDSKNAAELHQLFFDLRDEFGQTFVIVTHNNQLAEMADRMIVMSDGSLK